MSAEQYVRIGMLAAIRDMQEYVHQEQADTFTTGMGLLRADDLSAYLMGQLIVAGAYDDGQG